MTDIRAIDRVRGSVFSVEALSALQNDDCNVLFVSDTTMHLLNEFALHEVDFLARYASSFEVAGRYFPVDPDDVVEMDLILDVARKFKLEMRDMSCDLVQALAGIEAAILTSTSNSCACGTVGETLESESGVPGGTPPTGFDEPDPAVTDRLCKAANAIFDSVLAGVEALIASPAEEFLVIGFGTVGGLVSAVLAAAFLPVVGILLVGVAGAVVALAIALLAVGIDLPTLKTQLEANRTEFICALVEASGAISAREKVVIALDDAGVSLVNQALIAAMLPNDVVNLLWFSSGASEEFLSTFVVTSDCSSCGAVCELFVCGTNPGGTPGTCEYLGGGVYRLTSGTRSDGDEGASITWNVDDPVTDDCGPMLQVRVSSGPTVGYISGVGVRVWIDGPSGWEDRTVDYSADIIWSSFRDARVVAFIRDDGPFTVTLVTIPI